MSHDHFTVHGMERISVTEPLRVREGFPAYITPLFIVCAAAKFQHTAQPGPAVTALDNFKRDGSHAYRIPSLVFPRRTCALRIAIILQID
jgi:hypothetical protein